MLGDLILCFCRDVPINYHLGQKENCISRIASSPRITLAKRKFRQSSIDYYIVYYLNKTL
jgi:hypothetical protein